MEEDIQNHVFNIYVTGLVCWWGWSKLFWARYAAEYDEDVKEPEHELLEADGRGYRGWPAGLPGTTSHPNQGGARQLLQQSCSGFLIQDLFFISLLIFSGTLIFEKLQWKKCKGLAFFFGNSNLVTNILVTS